MIGDTRFAAHVLKSAVAEVSIKVRRRWLEEPGDAVVTLLQSLIGAERVLRLVVKDEARNKQIELVVVVEIEPGGAGRPSRRRHTGFVRHVGKRAVAVVAI